MGKKLAPAYANIYMADWKTSLFQQLTLVPILYFRYLNDIFVVLSHGIETFAHFVSLANNHPPTIKLIAQTRKETNFLDTTIFFSSVNTGGRKRLMTKGFFKPTDTHCLLHKSSFHPKHTFKGLVKSQLIKFHRICYLDEHFDEATCILFKALRSHCYSSRSLRYVKSHTLQQMQNTMLTVEPSPKKLIPLIATFNDQTKLLNGLLKSNFEHA